MARHHEERSHGALKTQEENLATHQKVQAWESYVVLRISVHHRTFLYTINDRAPPSDNCGNVSKKKLPTWEGKVLEQKQKQFWNQEPALGHIIYHAPARAVFAPTEGSCVSFWWVAPLLRRLAHELYLVFSWQTQCWVDHGLTFNVFILFLGNYIICAGTATEKLYRLGELLHYLGFLILNRISEGTQCLGLHWSPVGLSCLCICQVVTFRRCNDTSANPSLYNESFIWSTNVLDYTVLPIRSVLFDIPNPNWYNIYRWEWTIIARNKFFSWVWQKTTLFPFFMAHFSWSQMGPKC